VRKLAQERCRQIKESGKEFCSYAVVLLNSLKNGKFEGEVVCGNRPVPEKVVVEAYSSEEGERGVIIWFLGRGQGGEWILGVEVEESELENLLSPFKVMVNGKEVEVSLSPDVKNSLEFVKEVIQEV